LRCNPHCWQYAKPSGVEVPQRGHAIVLPCDDMRGPPVDKIGGLWLGGGGNLLGSGAGVANGPGGGMPDGPIIGAPTAGPGEPGFV
jgi:hypothetical protein